MCKICFFDPDNERYLFGKLAKSDVYVSVVIVYVFHTRGDIALDNVGDITARAWIFSIVRWAPIVFAERAYWRLFSYSR